MLSLQWDTSLSILPPTPQVEEGAESRARGRDSVVTCSLLNTTAALTDVEETDVGTQTRLDLPMFCHGLRRGS